MTDDKPGHRNQLRGLSDAMARLAPADITWVHISGQAPNIKGHVGNSRAITEQQDFILAAGRRTHWIALKLRWRLGGRSVLLTKPLLPRWLFDLCILPQHDGVAAGPKVLLTEGAINPVPLSQHQDPQQGLILIGGPSRHHSWDTDSILIQIEQLLAQHADTRWTLTTSRRTPPEFIPQVQQAVAERLTIVPVEKTDSQWLSDHYERCGTIWVSEDSVSMVYESLSSGAQVGILKVPRLQSSRVSRGLDTLIKKGRVLSLEEQPSQTPHHANSKPLQEADRIARQLLILAGISFT